MDNLTPAEQYAFEKEKRIELYASRWQSAKDPITGRSLIGAEYECWLSYNKNTKLDIQTCLMAEADYLWK